MTETDPLFDSARRLQELFKMTPRLAVIIMVDWIERGRLAGRCTWTRQFIIESIRKYFQIEVTPGQIRYAMSRMK